jgi:hypothetical protein
MKWDLTHLQPNLMTDFKLILTKLLSICCILLFPLLLETQSAFLLSIYFQTCDRILTTENSNHHSNCSSLTSNSQFLNVPTAPILQSQFLHLSPFHYICYECLKTKKKSVQLNQYEERWNGTCYGRFELWFWISLQCNLIYNLHF